MLPNAPYITDAERHGMPHPETMECPRCGTKTDEIYAFCREILGCPHCVQLVDVDTWNEEGRE